MIIVTALFYTGCSWLPHGQADHQAVQQRGAHHQQRPHHRQAPEGGVPGELPREPGREDHPRGRPQRADLHRRHRGVRHRQHEVHGMSGICKLT